MLQPKDTDWLNDYKKPTSDLKIHIDQSERMEKYIPCKWEAKQSWSSNLHMRP